MRGFISRNASGVIANLTYDLAKEGCNKTKLGRDATRLK